MLALHGWRDNAASFDGMAPLLPGIRLVALDLSGHGESDARPPSSFYHFVDWVGDVMEVANALGWQEFSLLGHSMGASVACLVAGAAPERVQKLALIEGLGPMTAPPRSFPDRLQSWLEQRSKGAAAARHWPDFDAAVDARVAASVMPLARSSAERLMTRAVEQTSDGIRLRTDPRLSWTSPLMLTEAHVLAVLAKVQCPTQLICASKGMGPVFDSLEPRKDAIKDLRVVHVDGGHHVHLDDPEPVAKVVREFLGIK